MTRVVIICEGQTEANFIQQCLASHLSDLGVYAVPSILKMPSSMRHKGGRVTIERLVKHVAHEYHRFDAVSTLVDFYGFKDRDGRTQTELNNALIEGLKTKLSLADVCKFRPYVQMYEFEGLLFSDISAFDCVLDAWNDEIRQELQVIRNKFDNPELINDSADTAPSKRLNHVFGSLYSKTEHGPIIANKIGLKKIGEECPNFYEWLRWLELLCTASRTS